MLVLGGDELQLPPVPMGASLLAPVEGTSDEHKAGVRIFGGLKQVYRLSTAMRFDDEELICILAKMRTPGGARLTSAEWKSLQGTEVRDASELAGTESWYEACYTWSVVTMAMVTRSVLSARTCRAVLLVVQAEDETVNAWHALHSKEERSHVAEQILRHTNMNQTDRLPGFAMLHVGVDVRLTRSVEPPDGVVDATGNIVGIEFHPQEPLSHRMCSFPGGSDSGAGEPAVTAFVVLRHQPRSVPN